MLESIIEYLSTLTFQQNILVYILYAVLALIILGVFLGFSEKIVIYRNFKDVMMIFSSVLLPTSLFFILAKVGVTQESTLEIVKTVATIYGAIIFVIITFRTFQDNQGIFSSFLALITKLPLSILFILAVLDIFDAKRGRKRGPIIATILLLGPVIYGLTKDKSGVPRVFRRVM